MIVNGWTDGTDSNVMREPGMTRDVWSALAGTRATSIQCQSFRDKPESRLDLHDQHLGIWTSTLKLSRISSDPNVVPQSSQDKLKSGRNPSACWKTEPDVCIQKAMVQPFSAQELLEPVDEH